MLNFNNFKKEVKVWMSLNPHGSEMELLDFCEDIIPSNEYVANKWVIDETVSWYKHVLDNRKKELAYEQDVD
jgi:hypothetical protein